MEAVLSKPTELSFRVDFEKSSSYIMFDIALFGVTKGSVAYRGMKSIVTVEGIYLIAFVVKPFNS